MGYTGKVREFPGVLTWSWFSEGHGCFQRFGATGLPLFDDEVMGFLAPYVARKSVMFLVASGHPNGAALRLGV